MKRIMILNPCIYSMGGGEKYMGFFCRFLENLYPDIQIDIYTYNINGIDISDISYPTIKDLNSKFELELSKTQLIKIYGQFDDRIGRIKLEWKIYKISSAYNVFINWNFLSKQIGNSYRNIYFCMFPPRRYDYKKGHIIFRIYKKLVDKLFVKLYDQYICISEFTKKWLLDYWSGIREGKCVLIYPPVYSCNKYELNEVEKKEKIIISVGRFFLQGHNKKQREMLEAYLKYEDELQGYEYHIIGSVSKKKEDQEYVQMLRHLAQKSNKVFLHVNCTMQELEGLYAKAQFFWHSTGYNTDESVNPEQMEHFGITTVEAMGHGVIPIVINKGGQKEIIENGINGFLWDSLEDCIKHTRELILDRELRENMSNEARRKAMRFSLEKFDENCDSLLVFD